MIPVFKKYKLIIITIIFIVFAVIYTVSAQYGSYGGRGVSQAWVIQKITETINSQWMLSKPEINLEPIPEVTFPARIKAKLDTNIVPIILYQPDSTVLGVTYVFSNWITASYHGDSLKLGTLPKNALVMEVKMWVQERFNAIGDDIIKIGHPNNTDAYMIETDVSSTGIKTNGNVADGVRVGKSEDTERVVYAYYTVTESNPTEGKALITLIWTEVPVKP